MKEETKNDLKELLIFNSELYDLYQKLRNLDYNGESDSLDFKKTISRIREIKIIVNNIEKRIAIDLEELKKVILYLDKELGIEYDPCDYDNIMCFNTTKKNLVLTRTLNCLNSYYVAPIVIDDYIEPNDIYKNTDELEYPEEITEYIKKIANYQRYYCRLVMENIYQMALVKIKNEGLFESDILKDGFYQVKYNMPFLDLGLENEMLDNNYQINDYPLILKSGVNRMFGVDDEYAKEYKLKLFDSIIASHLEMLRMSDKKIVQDPFNKIELITYTYCILSALILMDDEKQASKDLKTIKSVVNQISKSRSFIIISNLLGIIINDYEETKEMYQFISIGGKR